MIGAPLLVPPSVRGYRSEAARPRQDSCWCSHLGWLAARTCTRCRSAFRSQSWACCSAAWAAGHLEIKPRHQRSLCVHSKSAVWGTLLVAAGLVIAARRWELAVLFTAVFLLVYVPVIEFEEQHLRNLFPNYAAYAKRVPLLLPRLQSPPASSIAFQWSLYRRNEEYNALLGFAAGLAFLIWKALP